MKLKSNLHFHSKEDPLDSIKYTLYEGIDKAHALGFNVLASTCHTKNTCTTSHVKYAHNKGVLLIPGIEANIYEKNSKKRNHVVILNCDSSADSLNTFEDLKKYKKEHPEIFIIAPHPFFYGNFSLGKNLEKYIDLFDAIEISWFYTKWFNRNSSAQKIAKKYNKPFIATSDTHFFSFINKSYTTIDAKNMTMADLFSSIKAHKYKNTTAPRSLYDIFITFAYNDLLSRLRKIKTETATYAKRVQNTNKLKKITSVANKHSSSIPENNLQCQFVEND